MPPEQVEALRAWIDAGAAAPAGEVALGPARPTGPSSRPGGPTRPTVRDAGWARNPIDRFILAPLERDGIAPSPEADRVTLIRRVHLDLIGLPPTPAEVDAFLADDRPDAYERAGRPPARLAPLRRAVGPALARPGPLRRLQRLQHRRPPLDLEVSRLGHRRPEPRHAVRRASPSSNWPATSCPARRSTRRSPPASTGTRRSTRKAGSTPSSSGSSRSSTASTPPATAFLGLTVGCCQCHDHKYDPISQREYYQLFAFFNNADEPDLPLATPEELARQDEVEAEVRAYLDEVRARTTRAPSRRSGPGRRASTWPAGRSSREAVRAAIDVPFDDRDEAQRRVVFEAFVEQAPAAKATRQAVAAIRKKAPKAVTTMVVRERAKPRDDPPVHQGRLHPAGRARRARASRRSCRRSGRRRPRRTGSTWPGGWSTRGTP